MKVILKSLGSGLVLVSCMSINAITVSVTNLTGFLSKKEVGKVISFELQKGTEPDETAERIISTGLKPEESMPVTIKEGMMGDYIFMVSEGRKFSLAGEKNKIFSVSLNDGDQIYVVMDANKGLHVMKFPWGATLAPISVANITKDTVNVTWIPGRIRETELKGKGAWSQNIASGQAGLFVTLVGEPYSVFAKDSRNESIKGDQINEILTGNLVIHEGKKKLDFHDERISCY